MRTKEEVAEKLKELLMEHKRVKNAGDQHEAALLEGGIFLLSWVLEVEKGAVQGEDVFEGIIGIEGEDSREKLAEFLIADDEDSPRKEFSKVVFKQNTDSIKVYPDRIVLKVGTSSSKKTGGEE